MRQTPDGSEFFEKTHKVLNQPLPLTDFNLFSGDAALREGFSRAGGSPDIAALDAFGSACGAEARLELGALANASPPQLQTHDRYGRRVDRVRYHPAYHALMEIAIEGGLHASPWSGKPNAHVERAARFYMQTQVEAGHLCPVTMTFASLSVIAREPVLAASWLPKILSGRYDPRDLPLSQKHGATVGMALTEKQGGSDVRVISTIAVPTGEGEDNAPWRLVGHKFFVSAPMSDAFLVLAQAQGGLTCFLMPRQLEDGEKNAFEIMRLKPKMGNVSNATSEMELRGALAWRIGPEGRGVATILDMVAMTRFDCMVGSAAGMRMAVAQAIDHCRQRKTFGRALTDQPLMRNTLADLALEAEAALALALRVARALDARENNPAEAAFARAAVPLGKFFVCKRAPGHAYEAMECIGGSGFMEDGPMPRLYREAPVNAIWEGSGNIQCLDLLRAFTRQPETREALLEEIDKARGADAVFDRHAAALRADLGARADLADDLEAQARALAERLACGLQASLLLRHAPQAVAEAFCRSRLAGEGGRLYGALPPGVGLDAIIARAAPR